MQQLEYIYERSSRKLLHLCRGKRRLNPVSNISICFKRKRLLSWKAKMMSFVQHGWGIENGETFSRKFKLSELMTRTRNFIDCFSSEYER